MVDIVPDAGDGLKSQYSTYIRALDPRPHVQVHLGPREH